ncbi:MAG TPA: restriction endonuclease [Fimbriimonadaceae bacterium]|jgi:restriction endonuclease Mrr
MYEESIKQTLQDCSLNTLLSVTSKMLSRAGLGDVEILDRRKSRQKSRYGGCEILCHGYIGDFPFTVAVKVISDSIRLRMLSELAGTIDVLGADMGIIVSPHHLTLEAEKQQHRYHRRVEVIDGDRLAKLLMKHKIGVRAWGEPDYAYFEKLEEISPRMLAFIERERKRV